MADDDEVNWDDQAQKKFNMMLDKILPVLRSTAEKAVTEKARKIVKEDRRAAINEKDLIDAFFAATPFGFHGPMKTDMKDVGLDYTKYGHPE